METNEAQQMLSVAFLTGWTTLPHTEGAESVLEQIPSYVLYRDHDMMEFINRTENRLLVLTRNEHLRTGVP